MKVRFAMLQNAIDSFNKYISNLSDQEIEEQLRRYNPESYSGPTLGEICFPEDTGHIYKTKVQNFGWAKVSDPYFNQAAVFCNNIIFEVSDSFLWQKEPPPNKNATFFEQNMNPPQSAGFLLCLWHDNE